MPYGSSERTRRIFKIATAQAKRSGARSFKKGTKGALKRSEIAEAIAAKKSPLGFTGKK
jgi:hypothetical protein